jgi:membrane protein YdbS with pleckstrin-like domain
MRKNENTTTKSGIGFCGLLTIAFIVLKLCGVITWSWLWVLSPLWISWTIGLVLILVAVIIKVIADRF